MKPLLLVKNDPVETLGVAPRALSGAGAEILLLDAADPALPVPGSRTWPAWSCSAAR